MDKSNEIIRILSAGAVISSDTFAKASPAEQTAVMARTIGKPVTFVENFDKLTDTKMLAQRLLRGDDVEMELEFNGIGLSNEERAAITAVRPILEKLQALMPVGYAPKVELGSNEYREILGTMAFYSNEFKSPRGYWITKSSLKRMWALLKPWYSGGEKPVVTRRMGIGGYTYVPKFSDNGTVTFGCQSMTRKQIEVAVFEMGLETR